MNALSPDAAVALGMPHGHTDATVLIADESALIRSGTKWLVREVLGDVAFVEASDGFSLLRLAQARASLCLALVDAQLPCINGGALLVELARLRPALPVVMLAATPSPDFARRVLALRNIQALVPKSSGADALRAAIGAAVAGRRVLPSPRDLGLRGRIGLTPRQDEVHRLLRQGLSNKRIGSVLGISEGTVKNHVYEIFRALKATNRTEAARLLDIPG